MLREMLRGWTPMDLAGTRTKTLASRSIDFIFARDPKIWVGMWKQKNNDFVHTHLAVNHTRISYKQCEINASY